jgi:hypothetical protein
LTTGVVDTGGKWKKSSIRKILIILLGHLWKVELTFIYIFAFKFTLRYLQPDIYPIVCHRCRWHRRQICHRYQKQYWNWWQNLPPLSLIPAANLPPVRCRWYRWCILSCEYLREFSKKFETALMVYSGAWGKLIHEKNQKQKISWHCPFKRFYKSRRKRYQENFYLYFYPLELWSYKKTFREHSV